MIGQFLDWCQRAGFGNLEDIEPIHVAAHTEHHPGAAATFKQHIAAIRMLFSWLTEKRHLGNEPGVRGQDTEVFPERRQDAGSLSLTDLDQLFFSALLVQRVNKVALWKGGIGIITLNILGLGKTSPFVFPKSRYRKKGSDGGMATRAPFYGLTSTANHCLLPNHFVRIFVFPDSEKDWLTGTIIPGPLREFYLTDHCWFDPVATLHFGSSQPLIPALRPAAGSAKLLATLLLP